MAKPDLVERAAKIVAHHEDVRRVSPDEPRLGPAVEGFLSAMVAEMDRGAEGVYVHLERQTDFGRPLHMYGQMTSEGPKVIVKGDTTNGQLTWTRERLRDAALASDRGLLAVPSAWVHPYFAGSARSRLVWWGSPALWQQCGADGADAARLAWEALRGGRTPWKWEFELKEQEPAYIDGRTPNPLSIMSEEREEQCVEVRRRAVEIFADIWTPPDELPLRVLRERGEARPLQAIAYYLVEDPMGPGLGMVAAARATGSAWRTLDDSLKMYLKRFPGARRWPEGRPRGHEIKEIRPGGLMDHH